MQTVYTNDFVKSYKKLTGHNNKKAVDLTLKLFSQDPKHPKLRNHGLKGDKEGVRSIDVKFDLRILFYEKNNYVKVIMLKVGNHSELYG